MGRGVIISTLWVRTGDLQRQPLQRWGPPEGQTGISAMWGALLIQSPGLPALEQMWVGREGVHRLSAGGPQRGRLARAVCENKHSEAAGGLRWTPRVGAGGWKGQSHRGCPLWGSSLRTADLYPPRGTRHGWGTSLHTFPVLALFPWELSLPVLFHCLPHQTRPGQGLPLGSPGPQGSYHLSACSSGLFLPRVHLSLADSKVSVLFAPVSQQPHKAGKQQALTMCLWEAPLLEKR